ncbi:MAG: vWA domain-containing protein [Myxococcota bacterium]
MGRLSHQPASVLSRAALAAAVLLGCGEAARGTPEADLGRPVDQGLDGGLPPADLGAEEDLGMPDLAVDCVEGSSAAEIERAPVDIIFLVDNSGSMAEAIRNVREGLNGFAERITRSGLDYRILMLSARGTGELDICIPEPLAGDALCGDGERFFHIDLDLRSTQILEQVLGTLGQTEGFRAGDSRGGRAWRSLLRPGSTKSFVVVTDDNQRVGAGTSPELEGRTPLETLSFESYPGGPHPFQRANALGPGILTEAYGDLFAEYVFNGIYGADPAEPSRTCGPLAVNAGATYSALIDRTGGVRAPICAQASSEAWTAFFDDVANSVRDTADVACEVLIPPPPEGRVLDPSRVNVYLRAGGEDTLIPKAAERATADDCGITGGWYYDDEASPTEVRLCPVTCGAVNDVLAEEESGEVIVELGCQSLII